MWSHHVYVFDLSPFRILRLDAFYTRKEPLSASFNLSFNSRCIQTGGNDSWHYPTSTNYMVCASFKAY